MIVELYVDEVNKRPEHILGKRIKLARIAANLSQKDLGLELNVSQRTVCDWESKGNVSGFMLSSIASVTKQSFHYFQI